MNDSLLRRIAYRKLAVSCFSLGAFLGLAACGSDNTNLSPETGKVDTYLYLKPSGLNEIRVPSTSNAYQYSFTVRKLGGGLQEVQTVRLEPWGTAELEAYNHKEMTSYKLLPDSLFSYTSGDIALGAGVASVEAKAEFDPSRVFEVYKDSASQYIIGLKMNLVDGGKLRNRQADIILPIKFDYPTLNFKTVEESIDPKKENSLQVRATLNGLADDANPWDFSCEVKVPGNAEELVAAYSKQNGIAYHLLPEDGYQLPETFSFAAGRNQASLTVNIQNDKLKSYAYLLPLQLANSSRKGIVCDSTICYVKVGRTYTNPIISENSAADPTVMRAPDGYFYMYTTQTDTKWVPIYKSKDLVNWEYQKTAFRKATRPQLPGGGAFWAPEARYINGKYVLYFSWAKWGDGGQSYTAVATSDSPLGDFPDSKALITNDEFGSNCIDQFYYEDGGKKYMFYGSFNGIFVTELTDDGLSVKRGADGKPTLKKQVAGRAFEGTNIYKKNGYYYLFASINNCCDGLNSKYKVVVGRSKNLMGPYVDKNGRTMLDNNWELVVQGDGKKWYGPGHNSILVQDDEGTEWMIYHSYVKDATGNVGGRLGMLDRITWQDGWPFVKGYVPSEADLVPVFNN